MDGVSVSSNSSGLAVLSNDATAHDDASEAVSRCRAVLDRAGGNAPAQAWLNLSRAYRNESALDAAGAVARDGLAQHPGNVQLAMELAGIAMARRDFSEAVTRCQAVLDSFEDNAPAHAWLTLSRAHFKSHAFDAAEAVAREGLAKHPSNVKLAMELADMAMKRRNFPEAVSRWQAVLDSFSHNAPAQAWLLLSRAHLKNHAFDAAEAVAREGLAKHPGNVQLAMEFAGMAVNRKDFAEAVTRWRAVVDSFGDTAPAYAWLNLSRAHYNCHAFDAAEAVAREGLAKHPDDVMLAVDLAGMAMNRKDFAEAVTRWRAVLDSVGDDAAAAIYVNFAISLLVLGELDEAERVVRRAVAKHGDKDLLAAMTQITQHSTNDEFRDFPVTYTGACMAVPNVAGESCGVARALLTRFLLTRREASVDLIGFCLGSRTRAPLGKSGTAQMAESHLQADAAG